MKICRVLLISVCLFIYLQKITAQSVLNDSSVFQQALQNNVALYYHSIGENASLYNGSLFVSPDYFIKGDVFYLFNTPVKGSVYYDGILYPNINLMYDIYRDGVITDRYNMNFKIQLTNDKVSYFNLQNLQFVRLVQDSINSNAITTGFYEKLYDAHSGLFAKRKKEYLEVIKDERLDRQFIENDSYVIRKNGVYYPVDNKSSLMVIFKDRKKELGKFARKNKLDFKHNKEYALTRLVEYYDKLTNIL